MTNATKALAIAVANAGLNLAVVFGAPLTSEQQAGILVFLNSVGALIVALTYKNSPKRISEGQSDA